MPAVPVSPAAPPKAAQQPSATPKPATAQIKTRAGSRNRKAASKKRSHRGSVRSADRFTDRRVSNSVEPTGDRRADQALTVLAQQLCLAADSNDELSDGACFAIQNLY